MSREAPANARADLYCSLAVVLTCAFLVGGMTFWIVANGWGNRLHASTALFAAGAFFGGSAAIGSLVVVSRRPGNRWYGSLWVLGATLVYLLLAWSRSQAG